MVTKYRYYTFVARVEASAPFELADTCLYVEWDFSTKLQICTGYIQYPTPRATPKWEFTRAVFTPSTLSYMSCEYVKKCYRFGEPVLPARYLPPVEDSVKDGKDFQTFLIGFRAEELARIASTRLARLKRKAEDKANINKQFSFKTYRRRVQAIEDPNKLAIVVWQPPAPAI